MLNYRRWSRHFDTQVASTMYGVRNYKEVNRVRKGEEGEVFHVIQHLSMASYGRVEVWIHSCLIFPVDEFEWSFHITTTFPPW
jgi:hypothetical protein